MKYNCKKFKIIQKNAGKEEEKKTKQRDKQKLRWKI